MRRLRPWIALVALAACAQPDAVIVSVPPAPPPPAPGPARWSDATTWPGGILPLAGADVTIPADKTILLDVATPALNKVVINGTLTAATDRDVALTARNVWILGSLRAGTEASHDLYKFTLTLTGADSGASNASIGDKVLAVFGGGSLELHGDTRLGWTRIAATAPAGSSSLLLSEPMSWRSGDRLVVASTDYDPGQAEEVVVANATSTSVTLQTGLRFSHWGTLQTIAGHSVDERAEVALLTRNITIQGDSAVSSSGFGGHTIVLAGGTAHIEGVTFLRMGQSGHLARYPMHWHMANDVSGQYIRDASIWKTNNRCLTVHGSDNAIAQRNVCYDHLGHGYFLEDGSESGNTFDHNLGLTSRTPSVALRLIPSDATPATFWITNPDNNFRNNAAAGSVGFGFWFALPAAPTGLSVGQSDLPRITPLRQFSDNVAHSNRQPGLNVDNGPKLDLTPETTNYNPRVGAVAGGAVATGYFQNFTGWKHSGRAVWIRGTGLRLDGATLSDNQQGATFANGDIIFQNSFVAGESGNLTTAPNPSFPIRGYEFYDGTNGASNVTFANFIPRTGRPASALGYNRSDGFPISQFNFATGLQLMNANAVYLDNPGATQDGDKASLFVDTDGSVTGTAGNSVVNNNPFLITPTCTFRTEWNSWICPNRYDGLSISSDNGGAVAPLSIVRDDAASVSLAGVPGNLASAQVSILPGRNYAINWAGAAPDKPHVTFQRASVSDWIRVSFPYANVPFNVLRDGSSTALPLAVSLADLDASQGDRYYWDAAAQRIYAKIWVRSGRTSSTIQVVPH